MKSRECGVKDCALTHSASRGQKAEEEPAKETKKEPSVR